MFLIHLGIATVALGITGCSGCTRDSVSTSNGDAAPSEGRTLGGARNTPEVVPEVVGADAGVSPGNRLDSAPSWIHDEHLPGMRGNPDPADF